MGTDNKRRTENPLSEDAKLLIRYLEQYKVCLAREKMLKERLLRVKFDQAHPLSGINMDGMPKGNTVGDGTPCSLAIRIDEIEHRIIEQAAVTKKTILEIMEILDFLPENEIERNILELRYIDCCSWTKTCRLVCMTRTPANAHLRAGIYKLLEYKKVQKILADYKAKLTEREELRKNA